MMSDDDILVKHGYKLTLPLTPAGSGGQRFTSRPVWTRAIQNVTMENERVRK